MRKLLLLIPALFAGLLSINSIAQIRSPQPPTFETFQPTNVGHSYQILNNNPQSNQQSPAPNYPVGTTADNIMEQTYYTAEQRMGAYINRPYLSPEQNRQASIKYIEDKIDAQNNNNKNPLQELTGEENEERKSNNILNLLNEARTNRGNTNFDYYKSPDFANSQKAYNDALKHFEDMLSGKAPLSIKDALFTVENAFGNTYLNKKDYDNEIKKSANFIKMWAQQNGFDLNKNEDIHTCIQKFMRDKLVIAITNLDNKLLTKTTTHDPFSYDFNDFKGEFDHRNFFLTKTLATGAGQCNSLTNTYLVLAEALGAEVYLSFAPFHAFVKYHDSKGEMHSYEPTTNKFMTDKWYEENLYVSQDAKRSGIYLSPLNKKEIISASIVQLAAGYKFKNGIYDGEYITTCAIESLKGFPKMNLIQSYSLYCETIAYKLDELFYKNNVTKIDTSIYNIKGAPELLQTLTKYETIIEKLGWEPMPDGAYENLMKYSEFKGKEQKDKNISGKAKRSMFLTQQ